MVFLGQTLLSFSAAFKSYALAITARVVMGIGIECQNVTFYALIALWFSKKEHGLASAVSAMMMRVGMVTAEFSTPIFVQKYDGKVVYGFSLGVLITIIGLTCAILVVKIDCVNK